jgi:hypothetical protein
MDAPYLEQLDALPTQLVFIMGCHRSGTSLLYHLLAYTGQVDYISKNWSKGSARWFGPFHINIHSGQMCGRRDPLHSVPVKIVQHFNQIQPASRGEPGFVPLGGMDFSVVPTRWRLQRLDGAPDPPPHELPVNIPAFKH